MNYCPNCGVALSEALSYCNRCGARLSSSARGSAAHVETMRDNLAWGIVGTTITLLGMSLGSLVLMKNGSIDVTLGKVFVILSFAAFILVEGILLWRLLSLSNRVIKVPEGPRPDELRTEGLEMGAAPELSPPPDSLGTVTEQTTRSVKQSYKTGE
jgi:hypothetical protein